MTHSGSCRGGPYDGMKLVHWGNTKAFFKPAVEYSPFAKPGSQKVEAVYIGEYVWTHSFWQWVPVKKPSQG